MRIMTTARPRICPDCKGQIEKGQKVLWFGDKNICMDCLAKGTTFKYVRIVNAPYERWYYERIGQIFEVHTAVNSVFAGWILTPHYLDNPDRYEIDHANIHEFGEYESDYGILDGDCEVVEMTRQEFLDWRFEFDIQQVYKKHGREYKI